MFATDAIFFVHIMSIKY